MSGWLSRAVSGVVGSVLDPTILFSFDRTGFRRHSRDFVDDDLRVDMTGRVCLVTGGNSGTGRATAQALAQRGASVYLLCRNRQRAEAARDALRTETGNERVYVEVIDTSDLHSIRTFARRFDPERVDVLVHNAGVLPEERQESPEGHEITLATHIVGPHLLTRLLVPRLSKSDSPRVIWISSGGMYTRRLSLDDINWERRRYDGVVAYAQTKRMQVVLAELWAQHLVGSGIRVHSMHPGWADTPGVQRSLPRFRKLLAGRLRTPEEGADTVVWLAVSEAAGSSTGQFWFDRRPRSTHYLPGTREDEVTRRALWAACERWTRNVQETPSAAARA